MRINKFVALASGLSRRAADAAVAGGRVQINGSKASAGHDVAEKDTVSLDGKRLSPKVHLTTVALYKPAGYVCSRRGQGSKTVYDLLPPELHHLNPVGRLDKDSSGLLLLTNDGALAQRLTHPSFGKIKVYEIDLDKPLAASDRRQVEQGVQLEDGPSRLGLSGQNGHWTVTMQEGRNRQIRRTFAALGYEVIRLHRTQFGDYRLTDLQPGQYRML